VLTGDLSALERSGRARQLGSQRRPSGKGRSGPRNWKRRSGRARSSQWRSGSFWTLLGHGRRRWTLGARRRWIRTGFWHRTHAGSSHQRSRSGHWLRTHRGRTSFTGVHVGPESHQGRRRHQLSHVAHRSRDIQSSERFFSSLSVCLSLDSLRIRGCSYRLRIERGI
jgi:hypothetical protein